MYTLKRSNKEIDSQLMVVTIYGEKGSQYPDFTYKQGQIHAIEWLLGIDYKLPPLGNTAVEKGKQR